MGPEDTTGFSTLPNWPADALAEDSKFGVLTPMPFRLASQPTAEDAT